MATELCGVETPKGPCNMLKGHDAEFHRHRVYESTVWKVKAGGKIIETGKARVPLNYAITKALKKHDNIVIEISRD